MTHAQADHYLIAVFTSGERKFLFSHPEFEAALVTATEKSLPELNKLGVRLILQGGYVPPSEKP